MHHLAFNPTLTPEERFIVGQAAYGGKPSNDRMSAWRIRVTKKNPDLALTYGGHAGHIARLYLRGSEASYVQQAKRSLIIPPRQPMETSFRDVQDVCSWQISHPIDQIAFNLPSVAVARWAEDNSLANDLRRDLQSGLSVMDPVLKAFGMAIIPALNRANATQFFIDHVLDGVCAYLFHNFTEPRRTSRGGLAPWQERRAKDMMEARIASDLSLEELAFECGLSVAHFTRAFRRSCGTTPHKWLVAKRIERAKLILQTTDMPLILVAAECGFADQAHFTNVFSRTLGSPPGAFRRFWTSN